MASLIVSMTWVTWIVESLNFLAKLESSVVDVGVVLCYRFYEVQLLPL